MANFKDMRKQREAGKEFEQHKIIKKFLSSLPNPRSKNLYKSVLLKYFMFIDKNPDEYVKDIRKLENGDKIDALDQYEEDIISYWSNLMENNVPPGSISTRIGIIRVFFRDNNIQISSNIWAMIRKRGKGTRAVTKEIPVTQQMIKEILNRARNNRRNYLIILLMWRTGMRNSEVVKLKKQDINFEEERIMIHQGKGRKDRWIPLDTVLGDLLAYHMGNMVLEERLFPITTAQVRNIVHKYQDCEYIKPHTFRHSFAVHCLKNGMNIRILQKVLGHSNLDTTAVYLDLIGEDIMDDFRKVNW